MKTQTLPWLDLPVSYRIDLERIRDIPTRAAMCGQNTGNFVFRLGLDRLMRRTFGIGLVPMGWDTVKAVDAPTVVVSCANWLSAGGLPFDEYNSIRARHLKACKARNFALVGLGCNSKTDDRSQLKLGPGTMELISELSGRVRLIMTRDHFTREVLIDHGISPDMVQTCGCPSNLITDFETDHAVRDRLRSKASALRKIGGVENAKLILTQMEVHTPSSRCMDLFGRLAGKSGFSYVFQGVSGDRFQQEQLTDSHILDLGKSVMAQQGRTLEEAVAQNPGLLKTFYDAEEWGRFCSTQDLSIGQRIHGAVISLQHGTPALLFAHDQRTSGLGRQMRLPIAREEVLDDDSALIGEVESQIEGYIEAQKPQKEWMIHCLGRAI